MAHFDTIILGAGLAGNAVAYELAAKQKVLIIENDLFGGTCPNRGCDPKKMLYSAVEARQHVSHLQGYGLKGLPEIDWPKLMTFKRSYTSQIPQGTEKGLQSAGVTTIHGQPEFINAQTIRVAGQTYAANHFVIATGEHPHALDIPGDEFLKTSTDFLDLDTLPKKIIFIGGGYISFELANIAAVAGAEVTLIHHNQRPLKAFPETLVQALIGQMKQQGIQVALDEAPQKVERSAGQYHLTTDKHVYDANLIINATGRQPNTQNLGLEKANVTFNAHGIVVNDHLQTTNPQIYAVGDVLAKQQPKLTPVAGFEGRYVASQILGTQKDALVYPEIPTIVFGTEKLAQIGVSVHTALADPEHYQVETFDTTHWYTYNRVKDPKAMVLVVKNTQKAVVGVATLSSVADEIINLFADKLNQQAPIYLYPTPASDLTYFQ